MLFPWTLGRPLWARRYRFTRDPLGRLVMVHSMDPPGMLVIVLFSWMWEGHYGPAGIRLPGTHGAG